MDKFKTIECPDCFASIWAKLMVGERELFDGYHGECRTCGWRFEPLENNQKIHLTEKGK